MPKKSLTGIPDGIEAKDSVQFNGAKGAKFFGALKALIDGIDVAVDKAAQSLKPLAKAVREEITNGVIVGPDPDELVSLSDFRTANRRD